MISFYEKYKAKKQLSSKLKEEISSYEKIIDCKVEADEYILCNLYSEEIDNCKCDCYGTESLLDQFPVDEQLFIIDKFVNNVYAYYHVGGSGLFGMEILKFIYKIWPIYMKDDIIYENRPKVYPHKNFFELLYSIKTNLTTFYKMEPLQILLLRQQNRLNSYPFFNILGCLPLLNNGAEMMEAILLKQCYSDAEEYIYFALHKFPPTEFYPYLKRILLNNDKPKPCYNKCSIDVCYQFEEIIELYRKHDIDMTNDPELKLFFVENLIL